MKNIRSWRYLVLHKQLDIKRNKRKQRDMLPYKKHNCQSTTRNPYAKFSQTHIKLHGTYWLHDSHVVRMAFKMSLQNKFSTLVIQVKLYSLVLWVSAFQIERAALSLPMVVCHLMERNNNKRTNLIFSIDVSLHKFWEVFFVHFSILQGLNLVNKSNSKCFISTRMGQRYSN